MSDKQNDPGEISRLKSCLEAAQIRIKDLERELSDQTERADVAYAKGYSDAETEISTTVLAERLEAALRMQLETKAACKTALDRAHKAEAERDALIEAQSKKNETV